MPRWNILLFLFAIQTGRAQDETLLIPATELTHAPTPARIAALVDRAAARGWGSAVAGLRTAAQQAYETGSGYATAWHYLYRWSRLLGTPYQKAIQDWIKAVETAGVGHSNMATSYEYRPGSLSAGLSRELQLALLGNAALSEEFFQLLSPLDNPSEVLSILQKIHAQNADLFTSYGSLALAIAVVYDVPPPPFWPHGQVTAAALPRKLPPPEKVFAYFAQLDRTNGTLQKLGRLPADELKFLVDLVAPFPELDWARKNVPPGLADLGKAYEMIKYRKDRLAANAYEWPGPTYALPLILQQGGICVDQAYFASTAGKAKGIPTILFLGAGLDGRHAWFGYLDANKQWQLDCGRFAEQKFVVGVARNPQTWGNINDHEMLFITERFRALPTYKLSVMNAAFALDYLQEGKTDQALKAAREAVNRDRRNFAAWQILLQAQEAKAPADLRARETILRDAVLAAQKYPDLEIALSRQLIEVLRARGEKSLATFEEQRLGTKYQANRSDLSVDQAAATITRSLREEDIAGQFRTFNRVLDTAGRGAGVDFYDRVVLPFALHQATHGQVPAALQAVDRARRTLRVESGSQLERELNELTARIKAGNIPKNAPGI
ncbi:MAG TPA: hypothetical protein VG734_22505 [Lacunisphaera sp.]|nr:hypothetical protein [Lacunisphaera sp.]